MLKELLKRKQSKDIEQEILIENEQKNIISEETGFYVHESYNKLRSNIKFSLSGKGTRIIIVTSTNPSEGKSINALNVAISYAEIGQKVVIIDCDMRKPKQHRLLDVPLSPGLSNILVSDIEPQKAIKHDEKHDIDIIAAGDIPPNSTALLESEELNGFIGFLDGKYDIVIFDTPPVNTVIDSCILVQSISEYFNEHTETEKQKNSKKSVGVVFVVKQDKTKREQIIGAIRQLEAADAYIVGFILNNIVDKNIIPGLVSSYRYGGYGKYKYGYGYGQRRKKTESVLQSEKPKKKFKLKIRHIAIAILLVFAVTAGAVVRSNWGTIQMVYNGVTKDSGEIERGLAENDQKTTEILQSMTDKQFFALSDEDRKRLANGELSVEDAILLIKGIPIEQQNDETNGGKGNQNKNNGDNISEEPIEGVEYTAQDEIIAEIYLLRAEYLNEIDKLIDTGRREYYEMKKTGQGFSSTLDLAESLANRGNALEVSCDDRMDKLLIRLETQLKKNGGNTGLIKEIKDLYASEKELKKAQLVNTYYPKN